MKIGEAARRAGVNVQTLRYYERRGLLPAPKRSGGNYREYDQEAVRRVQFIKRSQALGFELSEVRELLRLQDQPTCDPDSVRAVAESRVCDIEEKLTELTRTREALRGLIDSSKNRPPDASCPILDALATDPPP